MTEMDALQIKPLVQAYIGDAVYEQFVRDFLLRKPYRDAHDLHRKAIPFVRAGGQADILRVLSEELTEKEADVVRRGRNAHANTIPKNADVNTYHLATGFEALIGFLHLSGQDERLQYILNKSMEIGESLHGK